jgi:hypothetical protein
MGAQLAASQEGLSSMSERSVDKGLQVIKNKLYNDDTLAELSVLQIEVIMELLEVCWRTTYFQVDDKFFQKKYDMAMGSSLSPIISNIFMEHFEKLAFDSAQQKQSLWLQYVDDTLWSGLVAQSGYRISSATSTVEGLPSDSLRK